MRGSFPLDLRGLLLVLGAIVAGWLVSRFWLYPALGIPDYAPLILRPILGFLMAWWLLRRTGHGWAEFGLARPKSLPFAAAAAVLLFGVVWLVMNYVVPPLASAVGAQSSPSFLAYVRGNLPAFLQWLAIAWAVGAFAEELLFRGFLLNVVARIASPTNAGLAVGIVFQAVLFGALHWYQGTLGFLMAGLFAFVYGIAYFACGRNLWPLILVHGSWNTMGIVNVYLSPPPQ